MKKEKAPETVDGEKRMQPESSHSSDYDSDESEGKPMAKRPYKAWELELIRKSGMFNEWVAPKDVDRLGVGVAADTLAIIKRKVKDHPPLVKDLKTWYQDEQEVDRMLMRNTLVFKPEIWIDMWKSNGKQMIWTLFDLVIKDYGFIVKDQSGRKTVYRHQEDWQGELIGDSPVKDVGDANSTYTLWIRFKSLAETDAFETEYRYLKCAWTALLSLLTVDRKTSTSEEELAVVEFIKERCDSDEIGRYWPKKVAFGADSAVSILKSVEAAALLVVNMPFEKMDVAEFYYSSKALMLLRKRRKVKMPVE